jgi:hypothetical protein
MNRQPDYPDSPFFSDDPWTRRDVKPTPNVARNFLKSLYKGREIINKRIQKESKL